MQQFVDREKEMKTLEDEYNTKESSFVVIYDSVSRKPTLSRVG